MTERSNISENVQMLMALFNNAFYVRDLLSEYADISSEIVSVILQYSDNLVDLPSDGDINKLNTIFVDAYSQIHFAE